LFFLQLILNTILTYYRDPALLKINHLFFFYTVREITYFLDMIYSFVNKINLEKLYFLFRFYKQYFILIVLIVITILSYDQINSYYDIFFTVAKIIK